MLWPPIQRSRRGKRFTALSDLVAHLTAQNKTGLTLPLYPLGGGGDEASRILHMRWNGTAAVSCGDVNADRLTPTLQGEIASGAGVDYVLQAGHNLPASGTLRMFDISAGTFLTDTTFTLAGNNLTLGASRTMAAEDIVYALQGDGTGEVDILDTGDLRPGANTELHIVTDGIQLVSNTTNAGTVELHNFGTMAHVDSPDKLAVHFDVNMQYSVAPGASSFMGFGHYDSANAAGGRATLYEDAGTWSNKIGNGAKGAGGGFVGTTRGALPASDFDVHGCIVYNDIHRGDTGTKCAYSFTTVMNTAIANAPFSNGGGAEATLGWGVGTDMDSLLFEIQAATAGDITATLKCFDVMWALATAQS